MLRRYSHFYSIRYSSTLLSTLDGLTNRTSGDKLLTYSEKFSKLYANSTPETRKSIFVDLVTNYGVNKEALNHAISLYSKNDQMYPEVRTSATASYVNLIKSIGNLPGGVMQVCEMRANILALLKRETDKTTTSYLRHIELATREVLTSWFSLGNLKLERLTWSSPGDILQKVAEYEAVHPVRGLSDFRKRLGPLRRCFYFSHEALPRNPLVMVHVALVDEIADSVQEITKRGAPTGKEEDQTTAIYYSITSTQPGLSGIDLGNMLIKKVATKLQKDVPSVTTHSTLSPIPGFRPWLIRNLKGNSEYPSIMNEKVVNWISDISEREMNEVEATETLLKVISNEKTKKEQLNAIQHILMYACAHYLCNAKRNGMALNSVANFHIRNGAELYRLNWNGDTSHRGINNSFGIMVNYRYDLEKVHENSAAYTEHKKMAINQKVLDIF
ncbi:Malonyl-CoA decarboxylase, mitochondrial [Caenorhabditis elegans]|uniref:Malonyl-CoA decarboxylase, mitochondrial n=1 Tax=Caenorhabditis elegans TaxID=6239 RepID=Q20048_CAEEL|nr:Malonyl-CoA decarboxylase, mitochondrial [Caenorhabditis elegans]CAA86324.2 Malonyl-CoA decarboxylase, mitochondrial [Caenorhabditis elegans]|eukprot:NP_001022561.1 MaLonyl CoA Decarboxylase [Caenorhabditis elegans]